MEMPKPGEEHAKLNRMIGTWIGEEKMHPSPWDPEGGMAEGIVDNRSALDGYCVFQDYVQKRGGQVSYLGHGVFTYDAVRQKHIMTWWDSMGQSGLEYVGDFDGDVLKVVCEGCGGYLRAKSDFSVDGAYTFRMDSSKDGENWATLVEGAYTRQD